VIALEIAADEVRAIYRDFCGLNNMHQLVEIYDEIEDYLPSLLGLHRLVKNQGMGEQEIVNVLKLANSNEIQLLQTKHLNIYNAPSVDPFFFSTGIFHIGFYSIIVSCLVKDQYYRRS
jgi:hypothetical protein